jgi:hypothetical protein
MKTGPKRKDITGQQFGQWTVIAYAPIRSRTVFWRCRCTCGVEKEVSSGSLKTGQSKSCGCRNIPRLIGQKFGRLLVLKDLGFRLLPNRKNRSHFYLCLCDCGVEKELIAGDISCGNTKSCGCYRDQLTGDRSRLPSGEASLTCLYNNYKSSARARGHEFSLSKSDVRTITKMPCRYCGSDPSQVFTNGGKASPYIYNGIDRVDSNKGYTIVNTVPCCKTCNYAKSNLTLAEFMLWLDRVAKFRTQQNPESPVNDGGEKQPCRST